MKRFSFASLRVRLVLLVLLAVFPALGLILYTAQEERRLAVTRAQEEALRLTKLGAGNYERVIEGTRQLLVALAELREVRQRDSAACSALFARIRQRYSRYASFGVVDAQGVSFCSAFPSRLPQARRASSADRPYFQRAVRNHAFSIGDYQIGRVTGNATINFGYPVLGEAGQVQAVVFAAVDLDYLNQLAAQAKLPPGAVLVLADPRGTILARNPEPEQWVGRSAADLLALKAVQARGEGVMEARGIDGVLREYGFTTVGETPSGQLHLAVGFSRETVLAEADRILRRNLLDLGLIAVLALLTIWLGGDILVLRQVKDLVAITKRLAAGDLNARTGGPRGAGELDQLGQAFDQMAESLQQRETERKRAEEALERRAREEQALLRLSQTLLGLLDPEAIAHATFEVLRDHLQADGIGLRVPDATGTHLEMIAAEGWMKEHIDDLRVPLEPPEISGAAWAVHTRAPVFGDHTRHDQPFAGPEVAQRAGVKVCLHVPMFILQRAAGVLTVNSLTPRTYTDDDVRFLSLIANQVAIALDRAREHQAVQKAEASYRILFDGVPVGLYRTTSGGEILDANHALVQILGYPDRDALLAANVADLYVNPEEQTRWQALMEREQVVHKFEAQFRRRDGSSIWVEVNARSVRDAGGRVLCYEGSLEDITERKQAEEALLAHTFQIEAVRAVGMEITRELDLGALLGLIGQRAAGLVGAESGGVYLWDEAAQVLALQARYSAGEDVGEVRLRLGEGVAGTVAQRREGLIVNEYRTSPHALPLFVERGITAVLAEPLLYHERLLGVIAVGSKGSGRAFTEQEREILSLFATEAAIAIENARLHEAAVQRARQLATLNEVSRTLTTLLDPQRVAQEILAAVQVLIPGAAGRLWERVGETDVLRLLAAVGLREPEGGEALRARTGEGLTGMAVATREPVTCPDVTRDPRFLNRAWAAAEGLVSGIILPLVHGDRVHGALGIYTHAPHAFTDEEIGLLRTFAAQADIALENARLFEQVRAGRRRLQVLSRKLVEVQEVERRHIARELHDEIGQVLTGLKLTLEMSSRLPADAARTSLIEAQTLVNDLIAQVRELSLDLRPAILDDLGLVPALLAHFERYTAKTRVRVAFEHAGLGRRFPSEVETAAYRIVQEALTNIARHAGVGEASVGLWADEEKLGVQIEDGGAGFDPDAILSAVTSSGLVGMRERAVLVGGHLSVESAPGAGTRLMAELPMGRRFEKRKKER